jgi:hypothetical protein
MEDATGILVGLCLGLLTTTLANLVVAVKISYRLDLCQRLNKCQRE